MSKIFDSAGDLKQSQSNFIKLFETYVNEKNAQNWNKIQISWNYNFAKFRVGEISDFGLEISKMLAE